MHTLHNNQGAHTAQQLSQNAIWQSCSQKKAKNTSFQRENTFKRENGRKFFRVNQLFYHHKHSPMHFYVLHEFFWLEDCAEGIIKVEINTKSTYSSFHTAAVL